MAPSERSDMRVLVMSGSLSDRSLNARLAAVAARLIEASGASVDVATMADFDCPSYDPDAQHADGFPRGAEAFKARLESTDALVLASPEYNFSMPGVLKNAVDWVSRFRPQPFHQRQVLLMSASPSMAGGNRGLWALRVPLEHLGARVYPEMFSLAKANEMLTEDGLARDSLTERLDELIGSFLDVVEAVKHYPCVKRAWVEFLGEQPEPAV